MADPKKTPAVAPPVKLRVKVAAPSRRGIDGASVDFVVGSATTNATTDASGFASFTVGQADLAAAGNSVSFTVKKRHHGPDPGPAGTFAPGTVTASAVVTGSSFDPSTFGLGRDSRGPFLEIRLVDGGITLAASSAGVASTRRLTDDQLQKELLFYHVSGILTLDAASDFVFDHDPTNGEFDKCDPAKCTIRSPPIANRVTLASPTIAGITFFSLTHFGPSAPAPGDVPGQRFLRDTFQWQNLKVERLDQRHAVGLVRLCAMLGLFGKIKAIYTQGVSGDQSRKDTHGHGTALDFGGMSTELPDATQNSAAHPGEKTRDVKLGTDFIVFLHWGRVGMWNATSVAADPGNPSSWTRQGLPTNQVFDDNFNYSTDPTGATKPLRYRLDPPPFQDPVPPTAPAALAQLAPHFVTAANLFKRVFDFATQEYTDSDPTLGPLPAGQTEPPPTPLGGQVGHFILHPDYASIDTFSIHMHNGVPGTTPEDDMNGRSAHVNHLHFQLGPTHFTSPRVP